MKQTEEVIVLSTTDALVTNLEKENITDMVIIDLKNKYSNLTINGLNDKDGYKAVDKARLDVKQKRIIAEKICNVFVSEAHAIHKSRTAKRTEIVSKFTEIEKQLEAKQAVIDNEVERFKQIEIEKKKAITAKRISDLQSVNYSGDYLSVEFLSDDQFIEKLAIATAEHNEQLAKVAEEKRLVQIEADRIEQQRKDNEAESLRLAKIKADQENERVRLEMIADKQRRDIEEREAKIKAEEDRIAREKHEAEQKVIREAEIEKAKKEATELALKQAEEKRIADAEIARINEEKMVAENTRLEALKSDKEKLTNWVDSFQIEISGELAQHETVKEIFAKFKSFKNWSKEQISNLK